MSDQERDRENGAARRAFDRGTTWLLGVLVLVVVVSLSFTSIALVLQGRRLAEIQNRQIEVVKLQNDVQLCAQYEITVAVRKVADNLGLPVRDITLPDIEGIDCAAI